jgi:rod shape-determining protein MreC
VTRVFPFTSEITLLTDKDFAIPVQVVRSGVRSIAYGRGQSGMLDLRFMAASADIQKGDVLVTTGIDGVYPAGLSVASVTQVEGGSSDAFARIICQPSAGIGRNKHLLILLPEAKLAPAPEPESPADKKNKRPKKGVPEEANDPAKAVVAPEAKAAPKAEPKVAPVQEAAVKSRPTAQPARTEPKAMVPVAAKPAPALPARSASARPESTLPAPAKPTAPAQTAPKPVATAQ